MMQTTDVRKGDDPAVARWLNMPWIRALFVQRQMGACPMIICKVRRKKSFELTFIEHDDMVEALASDRADDTFDVGRLPGRAWRDEHFRDAEAVQPTPESFTVDGIAIAQQIMGSSIEGEGLD